MSERAVLEPGPSHPIAIEPCESRVRVTRGGSVLADTERAVVLREADYPPVYYIPRQDARLGSMTRTEHTTYCPYKGDATYYTVTDPDGGSAENAVWSYEQPHRAMAAITGYLAFYPDQVQLQVGGEPGPAER